MRSAPRPVRVADVFRGHKLLIGLSAASGLLFAATTLISLLYLRHVIAAGAGAPPGPDEPPHRNLTGPADE